MFKFQVILDLIKLYAHINIYELLVSWSRIHNLLKDLNQLKSQMITNITVVLDCYKKYN